MKPPSRSYRHTAAVRTFMITIILMIALGSLQPAALFATPALSLSAARDLPFERLSILQGLSQNSVFDIEQDRNGFLWFATQDGLNRYDGYTFTTYRNERDRPNSLSDNWTTDLHVDSKGNLWIGTYGGGVNRFDPVQETFTHYRKSEFGPNGLSSDSICSIKEDENGMIWIGTKDAGFNRLNPETGEIKSYRSGTAHGDLGSDNLTNLYPSGDSLWIGTNDAGLYRFDIKTERYTAYRQNADNGHSLTNEQIHYVFADKEGQVWIATGAGLSRLNPANGTFRHYTASADREDSIAGNDIATVFQDRRGTLWIGTTNGLSEYIPETDSFRTYRHDPTDPLSMSENVVLGLFEDLSGTMWVGTRSSGVNKYSRIRASFSHIYHRSGSPESLDVNVVWSFCKDSSGLLWVGTDQGINVFDAAGKKIAFYSGAAENQADMQQADNIPSGAVRSIVEDREGVIWAAGDKGLFRFDRSSQSFTRYSTPERMGEGLKDDHIRIIYLDSRSQLWVGTKSGGLSMLDPSRTRFVHVPIGSANDQSSAAIWITALMEDSKGALWIGTNDGLYMSPDGLGGDIIRMDKSREEQESLDHNRIRSIHEGKDGTIWAAALDGGIQAYDRVTGSVRNYTQQQGLANNSVYGILEDDEGKLWMSTNGGLSRFDPQTETFKNYDVTHGLQSNEFNANAYHRAADGEMFFGGANGFNRFFPDRIENSSYDAPIRLTRFDIPGHSSLVNLTDYPLHPVRLSYKNRSFSFEVSALDYSNPAKNQYAYRLDGFDGDWVYTGNRRFASYTNLEPGSYVLHVKGTNSDGRWSDKTVSLSIIIEKPPWRMWWAYSIYTAAVLALIWGVWTSRTKKQRHRIWVQENELRLRIQDLERERLMNEELRKIGQLKDEFLEKTSHELRTPLHGIIGISESLLDRTGFEPEDESTDQNISLILLSARRLSHLVDEMMDLSKIKHERMQIQPEPVSMKEIIDTVISLTRPLLNHKDVQLLSRVGSDMPLVEGDGNRLQQVMYNLIGNAIKFTDSGSIEISARVCEPFLEVSVSDSGHGIPEEMQDTIFDAFEQGANVKTGGSDGLGLGLAITKELVKLHGGEIGVRSKVGQGSVFTFSLPIAQSVPNNRFERLEVSPSSDLPDSYNAESAGAVAAAAAEQPNLDFKCVEPQYELPPESEGKPYLLIVDDEPINLQILINHLSSAYNISAAADGIEALQYIESERFDLILLDIMLPGMSGYEVCGRIRERYALQELPIILISAKNGATDIAAGYEAGANDYVTKPFTKQELLTRIESHLQLRKKRKPLLTKQERRVLSYVHRGYTNSQMEKELGIGDRTITNHVSSILKKLEVSNRFDAAKIAKQKGLLDEYLSASDTAD